MSTLFTVGPLHFQFVALLFGLSSVPLVFTKVLASILTLLRYQDIPIVVSHSVCL